MTELNLVDSKYACGTLKVNHIDRPRMQHMNLCLRLITRSLKWNNASRIEEDEIEDGNR